MLESYRNRNCSQDVLFGIFECMCIVEIQWNIIRDETKASPMKTDASRSSVTETSQLNRHIRGSTENNFGVIVFTTHHSNNHLLSSIPCAYWKLYQCISVAFKTCWSTRPYFNYHRVILLSQVTPHSSQFNIKTNTFSKESLYGLF